MSTSKRGPYVEVNGPRVYLPKSDYTIAQARHEAAWVARNDCGGWARARYLGQKIVQLHDHDEPWGDEDDYVDPCIPEPVFAFETVE